MVIICCAMIYIILTVFSMTILGPMLAENVLDTTVSDWIVIILWPISFLIFVFYGFKHIPRLIINVCKSWKKIIDKLDQKENDV